MRYSLAKGNVSKTKAPSDEGAVGYADWGSEKVVNISCFVFRCESMNQKNKPYYNLKTKQAKENTFSLLPPQAAIKAILG